jgi:hypothetical protein
LATASCRARWFRLMGHDAGGIARHLRVPDSGVVELGKRVQI